VAQNRPLETDVCVWRYAPLVMLATQEEEEKFGTNSAIATNFLSGQITNLITMKSIRNCGFSLLEKHSVRLSFKHNAALV